VAFAGNLFTLFLFYELLTLSTYPLVSHKGDAATVRSARVYLGVLLTTSIGLFLPAIIWTYIAAGTGDFVPGGILAGKLSDPEVGLLLGLFVFGIGKAAVMPVHRWLPAAMVAPTPVSALLHAVAVVKAGVFTITKVIVYVFGIDFLFDSPSSGWLFYVAAFTIVVASLVALRQTNIKRLLAYSTIAQLSYVVMAAAILKPLAEVGAAIHMVAHAFGKITLFFCAGAIYVAAGKKYISQMDGLGRRMPITYLAFFFGSLSIIGMPPLGGFISKWNLAIGAIDSGQLILLLVLLVSSLLNAFYFFPIVYRGFFLPAAEGEQEGIKEAPIFCLVPLSITAICSLVLFFWPSIFLRLAQMTLGL